MTNNGTTYDNMTAAQLRVLADSLGSADVVTVTMSKRVESNYTNHQLRLAKETGLRVTPRR